MRLAWIKLDRAAGDGGEARRFVEQIRGARPPQLSYPLPDAPDPGERELLG